jgi:Na+/melibiose symporter-like transporter
VLPGAVGRVPATRVRRAFIGTLALANLAVWMGFFTPIQLLLPEQLEDVAGDDGKVGALGLVTGVGALVAVVATPLAGALSDRTTSRFGRRLPWLVGGTLLGALALVVLSRQSTVVGVLFGWAAA